MTTTVKPEKSRALKKRATKQPTRTQAKAAEALLHRARQGRGYGADTPELRRLAAAYPEQASGERSAGR